jgi:hypothetical protein
MANFSLLAKLGLNTEAFQKGLKGASDNVGNFRKKLGSLNGVMAAIGFTAAIDRAAEYVTTMQNSARISGLASEEFQKLAFATKHFGIETEKTADIIKDVSDKVGDFIATGAGPMADFFEKIAPKVGVTIDQFKKLSGKDALQLYVDSLEKANVSQNEMTFYLEAIASDASALLPLFKDGGKALQEYSKKAELLGVVLDDKTAVAIKNTADSFKIATAVGISWGAKLFNAGQKVTETLIATAYSAVTLTNAFDSMNEAEARAEETARQATVTAKLHAESMERRALWASREAAFQNRARTELEDFIMLERGRLNLLKEIQQIEKDRKAREQESYILKDELKALQLRASGQDKEAKALEKKVELMRETQALAEKYNLTLEEASKIAIGIDNNTKDEDPVEKSLSRGSGGISSMAAIAGGGRVGALRPVEKANEIATEQLGVLKSIEMNTARGNTNKSFK